MLDKHSLTTSTITYNFNKFLLKSVEHKKKKRYLYFNRRTSTQSGFQLRTVVKSYFKYLYLWRFIRTFNKKSGHNNLGTFTVHSKGRCKKYKKILYLKNLNLFKYFIYLVWYCVSVKTKTHYYLSLNSAGQLSYIPATNRMRLLSLMCGFGLKTFCKVSDIYIKNI